MTTVLIVYLALRAWDSYQDYLAAASGHERTDILYRFEQAMGKGDQ